MQNIMDALHLAFRQQDAIYRIGRLFQSLSGSGFSFKKLIALFTAFIEMFGCVLFDSPLTPLGEELHLDGYRLVFEDEFEGDSLDLDSWFYRGSGPSRAGFHAPSQTKVKDGNMVMTAEYLEDGEFGPGWYAGSIALQKRYCKGYFEIRCKCNPGTEFWSAFWIQADRPYDHDASKGGTGGAEIDIFESCSNPKEKNAVSQTIHCNGWDDDREHIDSRLLGKFKGNNIYDEYNTYGLEWTDEEYIFYINGVETARSSFGNGVSQVEETILITLELPDEITHEKDYTSQFTVDYIKIWQKQ
jgi:beta-glucanase (GH16 family)